MKHFTITLLVLVLSSCSVFAQDKKPFWDKGYAGDVELGFLIKSYPYATISTTHGYCFGKGWFIGLGGAFESGLYARNMTDPQAEELPYEGDMMVKAFLDVRKSFELDKVNLYADLKFGTPFNLAHPLGFGYLVRPSVGVVLGNHWSISAGVDWSAYPYHASYLSDDCPLKPITLPYLGVSYQF